MVKVSCCTNQSVSKLICKINFCSLLGVFFGVFYLLISIVLEIRNAHLVLSYNMGGIKCDLSPIVRSTI